MIDSTKKKHLNRLQNWLLNAELKFGVDSDEYRQVLNQQNDYLNMLEKAFPKSNIRLENACNRFLGNVKQTIAENDVVLKMAKREMEDYARYCKQKPSDSLQSKVNSTVHHLSSIIKDVRQGI